MTAEVTMTRDRMPPIPADALSDEQRRAAAAFEAARGTPVFGPFVPLLRSPELMLAAEAMGNYLRYRSSLPLRISEFVILITARRWSQQLEWHIHHPVALEAGLDPEIAGAVAEGRRPDGMAADESVAWEFATELHGGGGVSDTTYLQTVASFGEQGAIELAGICGYYTLLAMTMNVARTGLPDGAAPPLAPLAG